MLLTDSQFTIMEIFWNSNKALTSSDILERAPEDKAFQNRSIFALINALMKKGAIEEVGVRRGSKGKFSREFSATTSRKEYFSKGAYAKTDVTQLISALIKDTNLSLDDIEQFEALLREKKTEER